MDTLTLSVEQKKLAEDRIEAAGLTSQITVHLMDYRDIPASFEKKFDAFVASEMFEHVGLRHHATFFKTVDWALKDKNAAMVVTATSQPEFRYSERQCVI